MTRCSPTRACGQRYQCARFNPRVDAVGTVDASILLRRTVKWCPMFVDKRAPRALQLEAA